MDEDTAVAAAAGEAADAESERRARRKRGWDDRGDDEEPQAAQAAKEPERADAGVTAAPPAAKSMIPQAVGLAMAKAAGRGVDAAGPAKAPTKDTSSINKLCKFWGWGSCQRAVDCPFAHGVDELNEDGVFQESNAQILVQAEKDAASKGDSGKDLAAMLEGERTKLAAAQERLAEERKSRPPPPPPPQELQVVPSPSPMLQMPPQQQQQQQLMPRDQQLVPGQRNPALETLQDFANRLMREHLEKKITQVKALQRLRASKGAPPPANLATLPPPPPRPRPPGPSMAHANGGYGHGPADAPGLMAPPPTFVPPPPPPPPSHAGGPFEGGMEQQDGPWYGDYGAYGADDSGGMMAPAAPTQVAPGVGDLDGW